MNKNGPGDIYPQKEEKQGADASINTCIGFVIQDIKDKSTFRKIPDK